MRKKSYKHVSRNKILLQFYNFFEQRKMTETIREYFRRFDTSVTESVFSQFTMLDLDKNRAANEYLDYDRESLFRKNKLTCGIRNIDNTCYLSVTLQILYNIQSLRQKIFTIAQNTENKVIKELQILFAMMLKGSLCYADPTQLFTILKQSRPDVFVVGRQNDFHEVFTLVLEEIQKGMRSEEDKRFMKKMFYGKTRVSILANGTTSVMQVPDDNTFSIINLSSKTQSFEKALAEYKRETIEGYTDQKGDFVDAEREIDFLETPALLSFFINRVQYKNKKLVKDCSNFHFEEKIFFNKKNLQKSAGKRQAIDSELEEQEKALNEWIEKVKKSKQHIQSTINYLQEKEFENINLPTVHNPQGEEAKEKAKHYLNLQIKEIDKQMAGARKQIEEIRKKRIRIAQQNYSELYMLWGVMIHCGKSAESGHYKLCIKVGDNWVEFNDRRTSVISEAKIKEYKEKGQVCCLFYRRNTLITQSDKSQVPASLKKLVHDEELKVIDNIDNARILQALYQEYETVNIIYEFQVANITKSHFQYFFKPLTHLLKNHYPEQTCKGYLLYELIQSEKFLNNLQSKFLNSEKKVQMPKISFGFPEEYLALSEGLKEFVELEIFGHPIDAYEIFAHYNDKKINHSKVKEEFEKIRQLVTMKGIFYESMFVYYGMIDQYNSLAQSLDRIMKKMNQDSPFVLIFIPIRHEINRKSKNKSRSHAFLKKQTPALIDNFSHVFEQRFKEEIGLRSKILQIDESILGQYPKLYPRYIVEK